MRKILCMVLLVLVGLTFVLTGCGSKDDTITIGSKNFTESIVLSEVFAQVIEHNTDLKVQRNQNMGGTFICFEAIKNNEIDIYPEYTGTALTALLELPVVSDPDEAYDIVKKDFEEQLDIAWLEPLGLNNTYAVIVSPEVADEYNLTTISDLAAVSDELVFGSAHEFFNRDDGYDGLIEYYDMSFKGDPVKMDITLLYPTVAGRDVDVIVESATSAPILQYNLVLLEDDRQFFPPYYAAPIVRNEVLEKHPELKDILNRLAGEIDDETTTALNYEVDVENRDIAEVVTEFLQSKGLIS
ncbi:MAG: glycine betaine ABC transporter substrate-binding protein [Christensenellales bacterium]